MASRACANCGCSPLPSRHRKYCKYCGSLASVIWKRRLRSSCRARSEPYWRDWAPDDVRRAYQREYMRRWRAKRSAEDPR